MNVFKFITLWFSKKKSHRLLHSESSFLHFKLMNEWMNLFIYQFINLFSSVQQLNFPKTNFDILLNHPGNLQPCQIIKRFHNKLVSFIWSEGLQEKYRRTTGEATATTATVTKRDTAKQEVMLYAGAEALCVSRPHCLAHRAPWSQIFCYRFRLCVQFLNAYFVKTKSSEFGGQNDAVCMQC